MKKKLTGVIAGTMAAAMVLSACGSGSTGASSSSSSAASSAADTTAGTDASSAASSSASTESTGTDASNAKTTITFWHSMGGVNGEALTTLVDKFNKENTDGIYVDAQYQGEYDDAINKLKSAQIGNMGADLVQIYEIGTRFMIDSGWVTPMQDLMDADGWDASQLEPNIAAYYTVDNKIYSMPFNSSTPIMYYNKDMFKKAGITEIPDSLEAIDADADALVKKGGAGEAISMGIYGWFFEQFLCKQGLNYVDQDNGRSAACTKVEFDSNGGAEKILTQWKKMYDDGTAPDVGRGGDSGLADFTAGKSAITLGSTASLKQILDDVNGKFEVGTAYFPKVSESDKGGVSIGGASLWALNNGDEAKQEAVWTFVKFLVSPESQAYWNTQTGYFPVTTAADDEQTFKDNVAKYPQFQTALDQLHDSAPEYAGALMSVFPEARQDVEAGIEDMLTKNQDPKDTVKSIADQINKAISDYNTVNS